MGLEHGHRIDEAESTVPRDGSNGYWACICGWRGRNWTAHATGRKEAGSEDMRSVSYVPPQGCRFNPFAESPACVCMPGWGHNATEYEKYKTAQDPTSEYFQFSTRDLALALQRGPEDGFYRFSKPLYRAGTIQQIGQRVIWMSGDSKRIENSYAERIKLIAAEEETRMTLSNVGTDRLKKAVSDGLAAGHYHCFTVGNRLGHQEVITATYIEICDELTHRERQAAKDILEELPNETLRFIISRVRDLHLETITFNHAGEPVTWTRENLIREIDRRNADSKSSGTFGRHQI